MNPTVIITIGFVLRIGIAVWNGYFGPSLGAELDAQTFYFTSLAGSRLLLFLEWEVGPNVYMNFLMLAFYLFNDTLFFGSLISCFAWLWSAIILRRSIDLIAGDHPVRMLPLLIFAVAPTSVLNTGVTLREPFQLLFLNLAAYSALRIGITKSRAHWFLFFLACAGAGYLHGALIGLAIVLIPSTILFVVALGRQNMPWGRIVLAVIAAAVVLPMALSFFSDVGYDLSSGLLQASLQYQEGGLSIDARANYKQIDYNLGLIGTLWVAVYGFFQYLTEPLPYNISSLPDLGLFLENMARLWLVYLSYKSIRASSGGLRMTLLYLLAMFGAAEFIWSLGTVNWGTASRHHVPSLGLLVMASSLYVARRRQSTQGDGGRALASVPA